MIDLKSISKAISSLRDEETRLRNRLEACLQQVENLNTLPLPKEEFVRVLHELLNANADPLPEMLKSQLGSMINSPLDVPNYGGRFLPLSWPSGDKITGQLLHSLFREQIKKAIADAVNQWEYPAEVGPTRAERVKELAKLDTEVEVLQRQLDELAKVVH